MQYLPLYSNYLEVSSPKESGFSAVRCPFHEDKSKSAGIDLSNGVFRCLGCKVNYSAAKFISKIENIEIGVAAIKVDTYRKDKKIKTEENNFSKKFVYALEDPNWKEMYLLSKDTNLEDTFAPDYCEEHGFDLTTLKSLDVGFLPASKTPKKFNRDCLVFPYFYGGKIVALRFRTEEGSKSGLENSISVPWGLDDLTEDDSFVVCVEGETDRIRFVYELKQQGLEWKVISCPGSFFREEWERDFADIETVILIPDTDNAGEKLAYEFNKVLPGKVVTVELDWHRRQLGKDVTEWLAQNSSKELIQTITDELAKRRFKRGALTTDTFLADDSEEHKSEALIHNFLYEGQVGIVAGAQKSRKTWFLMNLIRTIITPDDSLLGIKTLKSAGKLPNILYIETEGSKEKFKERVNLIFDKHPNRNLIHWWWKPGIKLDNEKHVLKLVKKIEEVQASVLILDPFQRFHNQNEDSSTETAIIWEVIFELINKYPQLTVAIAHHFGKNSTIKDKWNALRGSSRMGGEVDFGIFLEDRNPVEAIGTKFIFEFRDQEKLETEDGMEIFKTNFDNNTGLFHIDENSVQVSKLSAIEEELKVKKEILFTEACTLFGITQPTMTKWVKDSLLLTKTPPSAGNPSMIRLIGHVK